VTVFSLYIIMTISVLTQLTQRYYFYGISLTHFILSIEVIELFDIEDIEFKLLCAT